MPRLSIVIPVCGNLKRLEDTLVSVLENRPDDSEILVVLDDSYDDPYNLKDEIRFIEASRGASLAAIIRLGIEASQAPVVHVLACGALVQEGWTDAALPHFADPWVAAVSPLVLELENPERVVSAGVTYCRGGRARVLGRGQPVQAAAQDRALVLGPRATAAFYRKAALDMVGPLADLASEELAAVDVALRLAYVGFRTVREPGCTLQAARTSTPWRGALRRAFHAERLFWRWAPCFGFLGSLPAHATTVALELLWSLPRLTLLSELAGRMLGLCWFASGASHSRQLKQIREAAHAAVAAAGSPHFRTATASQGEETPPGSVDAQSARGRKKAAV